MELGFALAAGVPGAMPELRQTISRDWQTFDELGHGQRAIRARTEDGPASPLLGG